MNNSSAVTDAIFDAVRAERLTEGHLWTPSQVGAYTGNPSETAWVISAKVTPTLLTAFRRDEERIGTASEILGFESGRNFWVVARQIDRMQHRLLLPLVGDTVGAFVRTPSPHNITLYLSAGGLVEESVAISVQLSEEHQDALKRDHTPLDDPLAITQDMFVLTTKLLMPGAISPPEGMEPPVDIFVTGVTPPELASWAAREQQGDR